MSPLQQTRRVRAYHAVAAVVATVIAFLVYASLVRAIHPTQDTAFIPERSSLAAAASNVNYGAPLGMVHAGVLRRFFEELNSIDRVLAEAAEMKIRPEGLDTNTRDGNGIGYILVSRFAFKHFGTRMSSVVKAMLLLMALSATAFLYRFRDRRALVVVAYFGALTFMLFTPLAWHPNYVKEIPIGGIRYFSLVGVLPAFHLLFELGDARPLNWRTPEVIPFYVQAVVLLTAILVRNSAGAMVAALAIGSGFCLWRFRRDGASAKRVLGKLGILMVAGTLFVSVLMMAFSRGYLAEGRFTETVWHRVFVSLGMSPAWPFGNLRETYDCSEAIPGGLVAGPDDINGQCVFLANIARHGIMPDKTIANYGRQYDASLREEFFNILRAYPVEVLSTFAYHKPLALLRTVGTSLHVEIPPVASASPLLLAASLANFIVLGIVLGGRSREDDGFSPLGATALFIACSMLPLIAVWGAPHTSADFLCFGLIAIGLTPAAALSSVRQPAGAIS